MRHLRYYPRRFRWSISYLYSWCRWLDNDLNPRDRVGKRPINNTRPPFALDCHPVQQGWERPYREVLSDTPSKSSSVRTGLYAGGYIQGGKFRATITNKLRRLTRKVSPDKA